MAHASDELLERDDQSRLSFFMGRHQDIVETNQKNFKRLLKRLKRENIIGLELIVAAATKERMESRFGHTMLRFVDNHGTAGDDTVLSFVADLDSAKLSNRRGLFGGYPVYPLLKTFRMFNRDYIKKDNRSLERHLIPTSPEMRGELILTLNTWWEELQADQLKLDKKQALKAKEAAQKKGKKLLGNKAFHLLPVINFDSGTIYAWNVVEKVEGKNKVHH